MLHLAAEEPQMPLLPVWPEIVIGLIAFGIVFVVFAKKLLPTINKALEERREAIEGSMEKAEAAQVEAQSVSSSTGPSWTRPATRPRVCGRRPRSRAPRSSPR